MVDDGLPAVRVGRRIVLGMVGLGAAGVAVGRRLNPLSWFDGVATGVGGNALGFRIYTVNGVPAFDPLSWRLRVDGLVAEPASLAFEDVLRLPQSEVHSTFHCVTGWSVPNLTWSGVRLTDLFAAVRPLQAATHLTLYSSDGDYTDSLSLEQASGPDVMLAHTMNGLPLPPEQGRPVRLIIPQMYGYKNIKWVNRIEFTNRAIQGYWEVRGYPADAYIKA